MKRKILGTALLISAILCSCDSDDVRNISVPEGVNTTQYVDAVNAIYSFPVESEGEWTATTDDKDTWIYLISEKGMGDGNVQLSLSTNLTDNERSAVIRISDNTGSVDYTIKQPPYTGNGENSEADVDYENSGLGKGVYINSVGGEREIYDLMANQIFQFKKMQNSQFSSGDFITSQDMSASDCVTKNFSSSETSLTDVTADLTVNVKYGMFSLDLTGHFGMFGASRDTLQAWAASVSRPMMRSTLNYANIVGNYPWKANMDADYQKARAALLSSEFLNLQDKIETLVSNNKTAADAELVALLDQLDDEFGPAFIKSVIRGGVVDIDYQKKESTSKDTLAISGTLTVGFNSLFSVDVKASADYLRAAESLIQSGTLYIKIVGGTQEKQDALFAAIGSICEEGYDLKKVLAAVTDWSSSIKLENSEISDFSVTGIWTLFSNQSRNIVKTYLKSKYPNETKDGKVVCPYLYNIQTMR